VRELQRVFPNVRLLLQNRAESFAFHPAASFWPAEARIDGGSGSAEDAHFFIALCSRGQLPEPKSFVYVPKAANMLRERGLHIEALKRQLAETIELFRRKARELEERTEWAQRLDTDLKAAGERIVALQDEAAELAGDYRTQLARMEQEDQIKTEWARKASAELEAKCQELAHCVGLLDTAESTVRERTIWAQTAEAQRAELAARLEMIRESRWVKMGRTVGLGPDLA
jgi:hypothetical protein